MELPVFLRHTGENSTAAMGKTDAEFIEMMGFSEGKPDFYS